MSIINLKGGSAEHPSSYGPDYVQCMLVKALVSSG